EKYIKSALSVIQRLSGDRSLSRSSCELRLADCYIKEGKNKEAEDILDGISERFKSLGLPDHPQVLAALKMDEQLAKSLGNKERASAIHSQLVRVLIECISLQKSDLEKAEALNNDLTPKIAVWAKRTDPDTWAVPLVCAFLAWSFTGLFACGMASAALASHKN